MPVFDHPDLLVSGSTLDDAGVFRLTSDCALVQTVDFFAPMVDDPYTFGQVAAANALSDIYAMGGRPLTCLNIATFPCSLDLGILREILKGGADKIKEAGAILLGGHTMDDKEPKYGLSVTGLIHPGQVLTNRGARPGDRLILTKPLGIGVITTALKKGLAPAQTVDTAVKSMTTLNSAAAKAALAAGVHACTDITGFGLLGHASEMILESNIGLEFELPKIPFLPGARELAEKGLFPGGARRNRQYLENELLWEGNILPYEADLLADPQTSGGLLLAAAPADASRLLELLRGQKVPAAEIGGVTAEHPGKILVKGDG